MNILLIIPENKGTIASVSYSLYKGLCKVENANVYVACLGLYTEDGFQFENVYQLFSTGIFSTIKNRWYKLRNIKKELKIDISISTLTGANIWNVLSGIGEKKIGVVHTLISQIKYSGKTRYYFYYIVTRILYTRINKIVAVNKSAFEDCKKIYKRTTVELVYNIHDFASIKTASRDDLCDTEKSIFDKPVILYVGGLYINVKAPDRLVVSYSLLKDKNINLVFIGEEHGSLSVLKNLVRKYDVEDKVFFLGAKDNPYKYMARSKILVSPSRDEGLPGVLIEALSLGVHCIATNSSRGVWEIMGCDDEYDKDLKSIKKTTCGYITPNLLSDEVYTEQMLAEAMRLSLCERHKDVKFEMDKYKEANVVWHYINV